jgi:ATP-dependent exoDNAse (exonuclease V) beta subunit
MILASAGSGKTFALTDRYVRLLALGAEPHEIVALTFTRKAAGEFFDGILGKLARAATDPAFARSLAVRIGAPDTDGADFLRLLRAMIDAMPRLSLGTFDSFFARIVRAFPLELGLAGDFEVLEDHAALLERRRALALIFKHESRGQDTHRLDFIEAFKRATFGAEEKRLGDLLDGFLEKHHEVYLAAPQSEAWGEVRRIWPRGCRWLDDASGAPTGALRAWVERDGGNAGQRARWHAFLDTVEAWTPGAPLPAPMNYLLEKALAVHEDLGRKPVVLTVERKKQEIGEVPGAALRAIVKHVVGGEFRRKLEVTRGIHAVLAGYERVYHDAVRRSGRLTFSDVQRLLQTDGSGLLRGGANEDEEAAAADRRALVDWRLDGRFQHWLLDEFQDTSAGQWSVLRNLVDEVVQDDSGRRSLFYVGDVKQAIYAWREGDARLMREIAAHYNAGGAEAIVERRLDRSFRSGSAILRMVNTVFGDAAVLAERFPRETAARWADAWGEHTAADPAKPAHAAWIHAEDEAARFETTLRILREIDPVGRGLSAAVLTQTNEEAARIAEYLRGTGGISAVAEADRRVCIDNPMTAALLALFQAAAHPGDTLAREHVRMTPLGALCETREGRFDPDALTMEVLQTVRSGGFEATVDAWLRRLEPLLDPDDRFSRERGRVMKEAARRFDEAGGGEMAEFVDYLQRFAARPTETSEVIRVMTIHKSKGLGFDVVVLPDLEGKRLALRRDGLAVKKGPSREVQWVLDLPVKLFHSVDPVLQAYVSDAEADACYDKLAVLYVALTRAKHGLYVVTKHPGDSDSANFPRLLADTLGGDSRAIAIGSCTFEGTWSEGDSTWFTSFAPAPVSTEPTGIPAPEADTIGACPPRLIARTPSDARAGTVTARALLTGGRDAATFGSEVHALLASVEWATEDALTDWKRRTLAAGVSPEALEAAESCLRAPEHAVVFRPPPDSGQTADVWRERTFEIVFDGAWLTGTCDRVVVLRNADGRPTRARVYDFKTDAVSPDPASWNAVAVRHAGQMQAYRRAVAVLTGLPLEAVDASVVLIHARDASGHRPGPIAVDRPGE